MTDIIANLRPNYSWYTYSWTCVIHCSALSTTSFPKFLFMRYSNLTQNCNQLFRDISVMCTAVIDEMYRIASGWYYRRSELHWNYSWNWAPRNVGIIPTKSHTFHEPLGMGSSGPIRPTTKPWWWWYFCLHNVMSGLIWFLCVHPSHCVLIFLWYFMVFSENKIKQTETLCSAVLYTYFKLKIVYRTWEFLLLLRLRLLHHHHHHDGSCFSSFLFSLLSILSENFLKSKLLIPTSLSELEFTDETHKHTHTLAQLMIMMIMMRSFFADINDAWPIQW